MTKERKDYEERIVRDCNGFYLLQCRFLPVEDYEPCDGWRSCYVSQNPDWIRERMADAFKGLPVVAL